MELKKKQQSRTFRKSEIKKILKNESPFAVKEAYSSIRTNIMFSNTGDKCPVYVITSPMPNEGKTLSCINMAISFALMDKNVLIIDGDMRNPSIHSYLGNSALSGFSEILSGLESSIEFEATATPYLKFIKAGRIPPNPSKLLASSRFDKLIEIAQEQFDYIFIDSPPVCIVTDALVLAKKVTGYICITRAGKSDLLILQKAVNTLQQVGVNIVGFIINDLNPKKQIIGHEKRYYKYNEKYAYARN